jgi:hypothetical protein
VEGYPTIFLIKDKKLEKYGGERTTDALERWIKGALNIHEGGKKQEKTRKTSRKNSKKGCKSCKSFNIFKLW